MEFDRHYSPSCSLGVFRKDFKCSSISEFCEAPYLKLKNVVSINPVKAFNYIF